MIELQSNAVESARRYVMRFAPTRHRARTGHGLFLASRALVLGFALSPREALPVLRDWAADAVPAWPEVELVRALATADGETRVERGYLMRGPWEGER